MAAEPWIAQVNIALPRRPLDSSALAEFVANLEPVNALADAAPGFVWRLEDASGDATSIRVFDDERLIINMSVWESIESLWDFVYAGGHLEVMRPPPRVDDAVGRRLHVPLVGTAGSRPGHDRGTGAAGAPRAPRPHAARVHFQAALRRSGARRDRRRGLVGVVRASHERA